MADEPSYKAQAIEAALRRRGWISRDQTLRDWAAARRSEGHTVQQVAALVWTKTRGDLTVSERTLRNWYPDLFGAAAVDGDPQ